VVAAVAVALVCAGLVLALGVASLSTQESEAVDDLPTVAEVIVATAHQHLAAELVAATDASAYEQLSSQLFGVASVDGLDQAVFLLGEVAAVSPEAEQLCPRLYDELVSTVSGATVPATPC